jgi:alpha-beta hydrolase superfamily lysophospholipase
MISFTAATIVESGWRGKLCCRHEGDAMKLEEYSWTPAGGQGLHARAWLPDGSARGAVAFVHGLGEHGGRYAHVAAAAAARGMAFLAFDLPGHGMSGGVRGHAASFDMLTELAFLHVEEARRRFPGVPVFLYGHSLGGAIVLKAALTRAPRAAGIIASSPGLGTPAPVPALKLTLGRLMDRAWPAFTMANGLDLTGLSRDPDVIRAVRADPLYHTKISARLGWGLVSSWDWFRRQEGAFPLPLLVMQGTADRDVSPEATRAFALRMRGDVTLKLWDGFYHELHNEPEKEAVLAFALDWMESRRPPTGS